MQTVLIAIPVLLIGGTEMQTLNLVRVLAEEGYAVTVCCFYEYDDVMVAAMKEARAELLLMRYDRARGLWHLAKGLFRFLRSLAPDIVHVQYIAPGFVPVITARLAGVKTVFATVHQPASPYGLKAKLLLRTAARICTAFFCNSLAVEKSWFGNAALYQPGQAKDRRHYTIYNAVDTVAIAKAVAGADQNALRLQLGLRDEPVVGIVGRLRWEKGHSLLIDAFREVLVKFPDAKVLVVGEGPDKWKLKEQSRNLGIDKSIFWVGQKSADEVYKLFSVMNVVAVPSVFEGFGLVAAEAMSAGLPVVGTNVEGLAEVLGNNHSGYLVPPGDSSAIADALIQLLSDPKKAIMMGQQGRERVHALFSLEHFFNATISAYSFFSGQNTLVIR